MSVQSAITVELNTGVRFNKLASALSNLYYKEVETNHRLKVETEIKVMYYGLPITKDLLDDPSKLQEHVKDYFNILQTEYKNQSDLRSIWPEVRHYRGKSNSKLSQCLHTAIHTARLDIINAVKTNTPWTNWKFVFQFNSYEVEFNPLLVDIYASLLAKINKVLKFK